MIKCRKKRWIYTNINNKKKKIQLHERQRERDILLYENTVDKSFTTKMKGIRKREREIERREEEEK